VRTKRRKKLARPRVPMLVPGGINERWSMDFVSDQLSSGRWLFRLYYGPEFTGKEMFLWSQRTRVQLHFIQPGKPTQNAFVESFNGKFRDQCLNLNWFRDLAEARRAR
jgi:putative transposase